MPEERRGCEVDFRDVYELLYGCGASTSSSSSSILGIASSAVVTESSELKDISPSNISDGDSNSWSSGSSYIANDVRPGAGERCVVMLNVCCHKCDGFSGCYSGSSDCLRKVIRGLKRAMFQGCRPSVVGIECCSSTRSELRRCVVD
jgi:hypothetical protein